MKRIFLFIKERSAGIFLLFLATAIISSFFLTSTQAKSQEESGQTEKAAPPEEQEFASENPIYQEPLNEAPEENLPPAEEKTKEDTEELEATEEAPAEEEKKTDKEVYDEIQEALKKYCNKEGSLNRSKCAEFCAEAKKGSKENSDYTKKYKSLRGEYCNKIDFIAGSKKFSIEFKEGETIFEVMRRAKNRNDMNFKYENGDYGVFVTEINGVKNGSDSDWTQNKYWILYVNGKSSNEGCSSRKLTTEDTLVEWKYEKYSY